MSDTSGYAVGSGDWWSYHADKLLAAALDVAKFKLVGYGGTGDTSNTSPTGSIMNSSMSEKLPWILGILAVVGIGVILIKR